MHQVFDSKLVIIQTQSHTRKYSPASDYCFSAGETVACWMKSNRSKLENLFLFQSAVYIMCVTLG